MYKFTGKRHQKPAEAQHYSEVLVEGFVAGLRRERVRLDCSISRTRELSEGQITRSENNNMTCREQEEGRERYVGHENFPT